jgi:hypothetical protein
MCPDQQVYCCVIHNILFIFSGLEVDIAEFIEMTAENNPSFTTAEFHKEFEFNNSRKPKLAETNYFLRLQKSHKGSSL